MQKDQIVDAAVEVLRREGLAAWTVAEVARQAGCAKGLVHYHHKTKEALLGAVAERLASRRSEQRLAALHVGGTGALDRLWAVLAAAAASGETRAYLSLLGHSSGVVRAACGSPAGDLDSTARAIAKAFVIEIPDEAAVGALWAALDGLEQALLRAGDETEAVHAAFHQAWLAIL
jgi:AcrR family transcriptional regulator